jgi:signal transduction histidine kinase
MSDTIRSWTRPARWAVRITFALLAAACVAAASIAAAALVSGEFPGDGTWTIAPVLAAMVVGGLAWPAARAWADAAATRLLHGAARSPEDVVRAFGRRAGREVPDDELLVQLAEALVRSMRAASAEVWRTDDAGRLVLVVSIPSRPADAVELNTAAERVLTGGGVVGRAWLEMWQPSRLERRPMGEVRVAPATHAGALLGLIVISRLPSADRFSPEEDASLAELGSRLGVVMHNRELDATLQHTLEDLRRTNAELRASRVRLVSTADAERRRIERNLHDGAQQHLVALAVNLKLASDEVTHDPAVAPTVFASLGDDVREAINELRSLAHGIYPPLLMDAGLTEALRVSARRSPSSVAVSTGSVGRYPPEIEAAVYFCCMEALQNAAKHAPEAAVRVTLGEQDGVLEFVVADDGPGIGDDEVRHGHGLGNMVDRMVAVGGTLQVGRTASGGAEIAGRVPLGAAE